MGWEEVRVGQEVMDDDVEVMDGDDVEVICDGGGVKDVGTRRASCAVTPRTHKRPNPIPVLRHRQPRAGLVDPVATGFALESPYSAYLSRAYTTRPARSGRHRSTCSPRDPTGGARVRTLT